MFSKISAACWKAILLASGHTTLSLHKLSITEHRHEFGAMSTSASTDEDRILGIIRHVVDLFSRSIGRKVSLESDILTKKELSRVSVYQHMCVAWNEAS